MKMKTHKAAKKRLHVTGAKKGQRKVLQRYAAQDHFNARETGKAVRNKRRDQKTDVSNKGNVDVLLPYDL